MRFAGASFREISADRKLSPVDQVPYRTAKAVLHTANTPFRNRPTPRAPFCCSTYASIGTTCSDECAFKRKPDGTPGGCFIEASYFTKKLMERLDAEAAGKPPIEVARAEAALIDRMWPRGVPQDGARGGRDIRVHVGGDFADEPSVREVAGSIARWLGRGGGIAWTYTHSWPDIPVDAFWPISVLASCETPEQVRAARARGYAPALVVAEFPFGKRPFMVAGTKFIPCPAETLGKTCVECRLCLDADLNRMKAGIAFKVHGLHAGAARDALVPLRVRRAA